MHMSKDPLATMHDHATATHWMKAVGEDAKMLFIDPSTDNVLQWAMKNDTWFVPDYDGDTIIDNERLEHFRLAYMHDVLSNMLDITTHLDDDATDTLDALHRLNANDPDHNGNQSWIMIPHPFSVVHRTLRLKG